MNSIKHIPINQLRPHPDNTKFFHDIEGEEWDCFKADIAEHGILQPILVSAEDEGCTVLSGHQRLRAARAHQWNTVPCIVWDGDENHKNILFSSNLGRQLTTMERYRLVIHLLGQAEDRRKENGQEKDENGRFTAISTDSTDSGNNSQNRWAPRNRVASMVPGVTTKDITVFRRIKELPAPVQQELFKFVEKENPDKRALKQRVNALNDEKRRLKAALRAEKKLKLKKKEMEQVEDYEHTSINPRTKYEAEQYDKANRCCIDACVNVEKDVAALLNIRLDANTYNALIPKINALCQTLQVSRKRIIDYFHAPTELDSVLEPIKDAEEEEAS